MCSSLLGWMPAWARGTVCGGAVCDGCSELVLFSPGLEIHQEGFSWKFGGNETSQQSISLLKESLHVFQ